ncbi:hypothetical protein THMA_0627 [Thermotoga maritima MSB8]|uniref:Uncharacterized protein n=3 Tax=Thermotoga TaxID=2335 RepID=Q9WZ80_THEMA|nr:hypothetical protein TM_0611 [Thermotoga maritima MSB8]ABQ46330.1 hypothetical protein Tpet_0301 [Thermotoga petrophila RKU-1]ADA66495.1 conserved hypothetical protein [Thermotoga petrophila RKU-10]AKE26534.1 hypothetical protein THMC_0627 [Thermotoga maritima]AGL49536.1 hypothetical protein Tmari_0611 [Thermotoga maritima MSB8]
MITQTKKSRTTREKHPPVVSDTPESRQNPSKGLKGSHEKALSMLWSESVRWSSKMW